MKTPYAKRRRKAAHSKDTDAFVEALRRKILDLSEGNSGHQVVKALFKLTDEMWHAGIDAAWDEAQMKSRGRAGNIFCITWLTMLATELEQMSRRRKARQRSRKKKKN